MAVKTNLYASPTSQDNSRGPSSSVWADCPIEDFIQGAGGGIGTAGYLFEDDFIGMPGKFGSNAEAAVGKWSVFTGTNAVAGTAADTTNLPLEGGVFGLTGGANNGVSVSMATDDGAFRLISPATGFPFGQKLWFEARIAVGSVASGSFDFFVGLMDSGAGGTRITSAADLVFSTANTIKTAAGNGGCLGFWRRATTNPTDYAVVYNVNGGTAQLPGAATTLNKLALNYGAGTPKALSVTSGSLTGTDPTAGFIKLGFIFDPTPSCPTLAAPAAITTNQTTGNVYAARVRFFVNGQQVSAFLNTSDVQASTFPSTWMVPTIGFRSGGTGVAAGIAYCDWIRCAQLASY